MGIGTEIGTGHRLWKLLVVISLVASWEAQAVVKDSAPGTMMYCDENVAIRNQTPPFKPGELGCTYPTAMAAAEAHAATYNEKNIVKMAYDSCVDLSPGSTRGLYYFGNRTAYVTGYKCHYYYYGFSDGVISTKPFYVTYFPIAVSCPIPSYNPVVPYQYFDIYTSTCVRYVQYSQNFTITLTGGNETEPSKGSDIKTLPIIATVIDQSTNQPPKNPVQVKISLKVDPTSGGHDHGDSTRPRGGIAEIENCPPDETCWTKQTDPNGQVVFNFNAPEASGTHTISATCDGCSNGPQDAVIEVRVKESQQPDWDTITASPTEYALIGGETGKTHHDNHYLTGKARENLLALVDEYNKAFPSGPLLQLNDASLVWGGRFDINGKWSGAHSNHRRGVVIDIRANQDVTAIPQARFDQFEAMAKKSGAYADLHCAFSGKYICPACLLDTGPNRHYHVRLLGQGIDR